VIIDAHAHVWPDAIAAQVLAGRPAGLQSRHDGTVSGLLRTMDGASVDRALALGVAGSARTVARTNEFIGALDRSRLIPFGTVHPQLSDEDNLRYLQENGIRGVKLHPLFQDISLGDARVVDLVRALAEHGITIITHAGAGGDDVSNERGSPHHLAALLAAVPALRLIACHFGGYHLLDEAERCLIGTRLYLETSWPPTVADLPAGRIRALIDRHGSDRVVFGSDWPMTDPGTELAAVRSWSLPPDVERGVLGGNLAGLLGIES